MIRRSKRLPREEFQSRAYRLTRTPHFSLKMKSNSGKGVRIGVVVGKNVAPSAVRRNFWKRQGRDVLKSVVRGDRDALIVFGPKVNDLTRRQFHALLAGAIREIE